MLIIKKIFYYFIIILIHFLSVISFSALAAEKKPPTQEQFISQVEFLFLENPEKLNYDEVVALSNGIFLQRATYPKKILAKTYLLLANVASNKGELETAYQFSQDGLATTAGHEKIKLHLQIKLASILSAKKQYKQLLKTVQQAINMPQNKENMKYFLLALSYRSVAFAMLNQHDNALSDLQKVEYTIKQNPSFSERISLLTILASAHYHLGDYQTALTIRLKVLKLRFRLKNLENVGQTYYHLANAYYRLNRFNDAYNAYWEAKKYAEKKAAYIYAAYASQGLGLTLIQQKQYHEAKSEILAAKTLFYQHNLARPYLETLTSLALLNNLLEQKNTDFTLLLEAEKLSLNIELTNDYIVLYQLLSDMYKEMKEINKAYLWQKEYSAALLKEKQSTIYKQQLLTKQIVRTNTLENTSASDQTRRLSIKLAEQSELATSSSTQYHQQQTLIFVLLVITLLSLSLVLFLWLKHRSTKLKKTHEALEQSNDVVASPLQTKHLYQKSFNMARKYSYPLTLSYISISNWQELTFQFNKKIVTEVNREIANVINSHINEFENAGIINEGEYLLLFPHQDKEEVTIIIEKLVSALKLRFFANLGEFSVIIAYSIESPNFQDIDPYIFLSQLSDSIKIA